MCDYTEAFAHSIGEHIQYALAGILCEAVASSVWEPEGQKSTASINTASRSSLRFSMLASSKVCSSSFNSGSKGGGGEEAWSYWTLDRNGCFKSVICPTNSNIDARKSVLLR